MKNYQFSLPLVFVKCCFLTLILLIPFFSFAQLGKYEFTGTSTADKQFNEVTAQPLHAIFSPFDRIGVHYYKASGVFNSRYWESPTNSQIGYIEFRITAQPGYVLHLTKLFFDSYSTDQGPTKVKVAHNASGNFATDTLLFIPSNEDEGLKTTIWDFPDINTLVGATITFRIYGLKSIHSLGAYRVDNVALYGSVVPQVYVNEFNYANTSVTKTGFVEVVAPADFKELNTVTLSLYNQEGKPYKYYTLADFKFLDKSVYGDKKIYYLDIPTGLVDGTGGISLSSGNYLNQFISYGGSITSMEGPAKGVVSEDLGITQSQEDGAYNSLALMPNLNKSLDDSLNDSSPATVWEKGEVDNNTKGYDNTQPYQTLPVELIYFRAKATFNGVQFNWATATEINNKEFVIEQSLTENLDFKPIGKVEGHGTTLQAQQYEFLDTKSFTGTAYYRLKQIDIDGANTYTKVLAVKSKETITTPIAFYPNPATESIQLSLGTLSNSNETQVQVINLQGQVLLNDTYKQLNRNDNVSISLANVPAGNYYLVVIRDGKREAKAFLKK